MVLVVITTFRVATAFIVVWLLSEVHKRKRLEWPNPFFEMAIEMGNARGMDNGLHDESMRSPKRLRPEEDIESISIQVEYDVFIGHRGPDIKTGFVRFLFECLKAKGLRPFLDCRSIDMGKDSWECLEHAIKKTSIAVVIFSRNITEMCGA